MHEQSISFRTKHCAAHIRNDDCARKCEFGWEWNGQGALDMQQQRRQENLGSGRVIS